ncbi:hypothetical protein LCGC14_2518630, partial [marine sediment metagenome]
VYSAWTGAGTVKLRVDGSAFVTYDRNGEARQAVKTLSGLWDWEGWVVDAVADGSVVKFASVADQTVTLGKITLPSLASRVHGGLKYVSDVETLNVEAARGTIQGKKMKVGRVTTRFKKSRLPLVGPDSDHLGPTKQRETEKIGAPVALFTGDKKVTIQPSWKSNGRLFYRQVDPLPFTILAVIPELEVEDDD